MLLHIPQQACYNYNLWFRPIDLVCIQGWGGCLLSRYFQKGKKTFVLRLNKVSQYTVQINHRHLFKIGWLMVRSACHVVNVVLLVAATKILAAKVGTSINQAHQPWQPVCLFCVTTIALVELIFCKLIWFSNLLFLDAYEINAEHE